MLVLAVLRGLQKNMMIISIFNFLLMVKELVKRG